MSTRTKPLPNHREGVREVMLDKNLRVLPVISATRVSYTPDRVTTYQRPAADGYIVRCENRNGTPIISLNRYLPHLDTITPVADDETLVKRILSDLAPELRTWLEDATRNELSNLLPAGYGWDGRMTETEYSKHTRIRNLFISPTIMTEKEQEWFTDIVKQAVRTSTTYIKDEWLDAYQLKTMAIPINRFLSTTKVYVVTFDKDGNRKIHFVRRVIHAGKNKAPPEVFNLPEGTVRAILLRTDVMIGDNTNYGVAIDLYTKTGAL